MELAAFLSNVLTRFAPIPADELAHLLPHLKAKTLQKSEVFIRQGEVPTSVGIVLEGLLRKYYVGRDGHEVTRDFVCQGEFFASYSSLILKTPSTINIEAVEPTQIALVDFKHLQKLFDRNQAWERVGRLIAEELFIRKERREFELLTLDATERYEAFRKAFPTICQRIPRYLVASYLGISPVSLSRLSAKKTTRAKR